MFYVGSKEPNELLMPLMIQGHESSSVFQNFLAKYFILVPSVFYLYLTIFIDYSMPLVDTVFHEACLGVQVSSKHGLRNQIIFSLL